MYDRKVTFDSKTKLATGLALVLGAKSATGVHILNTQAALDTVVKFLNDRGRSIIGEIDPVRFKEGVKNHSIKQFINDHYGTIDYSNLAGGLRSYKVEWLSDAAVGIYVTMEPAEKLVELLTSGAELMFTSRTILQRSADTGAISLASIHGIDAVFCNQVIPDIHFDQEQIWLYQTLQQFDQSK